MRHSQGDHWDLLLLEPAGRAYATMAGFAKGPSVSGEEAELAAKKAGFKNRADLGFYLRSLLTSHHDTLAVPVAP